MFDYELISQSNVQTTILIVFFIFQGRVSDSSIFTTDYSTLFLSISLGFSVLIYQNSPLEFVTSGTEKL